MRVTKEVPVTFEQFKSNLVKKAEYLNNGGTPYRIKTAELALEVADLVQETSPFTTQELALSTVKKYLSEDEKDPYRLLDVAKMLYVILNNLVLEANRPEELKKLLEERRRNLKPYKLVLV